MIDLQIGPTWLESEIQISVVQNFQTDHTATLVEIHEAKYTPAPATMRLNLKTANWTLFKTY